MTEKPRSIMISKERQELNRRDLLKVLSASGIGVTVAAFLPQKWLAPSVETGVLPAHAQATRNLRVTHMDVFCDPNDNNYFTADAYCEDDLCRLYVDETNISVVTTPQPAQSWSYLDHEGEGCSSRIRFSFTRGIGATTLFFTLTLGDHKRMADYSRLILPCIT